MALQELSPPPQITGPAQLGAAIVGAGDRYATNKRQDQLIAQARANQLADITTARGWQLSDVERARANQLSDRGITRGWQLEDTASERGYKDQRFNMERFARLDDEKKRLLTELSERMKQDAINAGLLTADEAGRDGAPGDPVKIEAAVHELARRGALEKYKPLIQAGALNVADVMNPTAVDTATQTEATRTAKLLAAERDQARLQQEDFSRLRQEEQSIQGQIKSLSDDLQRTADYMPTETEVSNASLALAQSLKKPGEIPSRAEIDSQRASAIQKLRENGIQNQFIDKQVKTVQLQALYQQLQSIKANTQEYIRKGIGPSVMTTPAAAPVTPAPSGATMGGNPMQSFQEMLSGGTGGGSPLAAGAPGVNPLVGDTPPAMAPAYSVRGLTERAQDFGDRFIGAPLQAAGRKLAQGAVGVMTGDYSWPGSPSPVGLPTPAEVQAAPGRPITSAPSIFPTPGNWWSGGR